LACLIKRHQDSKTNIPESTVFNWTFQAATGLRSLHTAHVIHRDIKPSNIFLTAENKIKLGDLGGAKLSEATMNSSASGNKTLAGTYVYFSPEMMERTGYSFETDIWSLGCTVYELLFLKVAFPRLNDRHDSDLLQISDDYFLSSILKR
jgi:serine/threonine protein kinase